MKALIVLGLLAALLAVFFIGGGKPVSAPAKTSGFKVGLVTPGAVNDGGWSQNAYMGLKQIESKLNAQAANQVAGSPNEAFAAFRNFADQDFNLVIGHASEWFDPKTTEIAAAHPKLTILISGSEHASGKVCGVRYVLEDATYVLGQIAASMSKSGILGCVGPKKVPVIESTFFAFEEGAKSVRKDIRVVQRWTDDWADIARAKEQTTIMIQQGADFIFHNANDGAPGVFQAVKENKDKGVFAFGSNADQAAMADDVILASAVLDIPAAFLNLAKQIQDGTFKPEPKFIGLPDGLVWIAYNKKLESKIPEKVRKLADETVSKIKSKQFQVPRMTLK